MKKTKLITGLLVTVLLTLALVLPAAAQVEPPVVEAEMPPGESMTLTKEVQTPEIPPNPDIYFMSDTTGSMEDVIEAMQDNADDIMAAILLAQPTAQFGVGNYRDYPGTVHPFRHQQAITDNTALVSAAIGAWAASGGGDGSEGQFYALTRLADPDDPEGIGWRGIGTKIVVWFGDAPAHDPVPDPPTLLGYDIDEAGVRADLVAAGIKVIAISIDTGYYPAGLDDDPLKDCGDYAAYPGYVPDGTAGQATRIATDTSGAYLFAATPEEAAEAVLKGIEELTTDVWWEVKADAGLTVELEPAVYYDVSGNTTVRFLETITVAKDAPQCKTIHAVVVFYANTYPEEVKPLGKQRISIHVLDITPPKVKCVESVNPHGNNVPGEKRSDNAKSKARNPDGFYQLFAEDNCDPEPEIYVSYIGADPMLFFGPFDSGIVIKFTEAPGTDPSCKKIGSTNGQAGAVTAHITLPSDPVIIAIDASGNMNRCRCLVPPPPK